MSILPATQNKRRALVRSAMVVLGLALLACVFAARVWEADVHGVTLAVLIIFCALAILEFSVFDEFTKQNHYVAWYWGSLAGFVIVALAQVVFSLDAQIFVPLREMIADQLGNATPLEALLTGMMATPVLMAAGFFIVRGVSRLNGR